MSGLKETALLGMLLFSLTLAGCGSKEAQNVTIIGGADGPTSIYLAGKLDSASKEQAEQIITSDIVVEEAEDKAMTLTIDGTSVPVTWESNDSVKELEGLCPLTVNMSMYGGFEQVGSIGQSIERDDKQITTEPGDIVLYSGNQIVVFYGSNSWAYTRLGHVDLSEDELAQILGNGDVTLVLQLSLRRFNMSRLKELRAYIDKKINKIDDEDKRISAAAHLYGVSLAAQMLAKKRGLDSELAAMAGMLHDLHAYKTGSYDDHAHLGAELARKVLGKLELTTPEETDIICSAIYHHDDKAAVDSPMDELLKDADVIDHCFKDASKPVKEKEQKRYDALCKELGLA